MPARKTYRTKAIILDRTPLAEQDLILTLLAESGEEVRAVAKGARKPGGRLAARSELFCETDFLLSRGRTLDMVSEASVVDAHGRLRGSMERVSAASVICEVARLTCFADAEDPFLFPICARALRACEQAQDQERLDLVVVAYALKVLAHGGWRPELSSCVLCGDQEISHLSVAAGGALCSSCAKDISDAKEVGASLIAWIKALIGMTFDAILESEVDLATSSELMGFAHRWAATHLDARLRSFEFCQSV
ncbi:MAG: DNA repair protein RecO [Atopobiaceae bacterium]|nr:DNA repair protein RecO [Atopobiaceae bacterium]